MGLAGAVKQHRAAIVLALVLSGIAYVVYARSRINVLPSSIPSAPRVAQKPGLVSDSEYYRQKMSQHEYEAARAASESGRSYVAAPNSPVEKVDLSIPVPPPTPTPTPTPAKIKPPEVTGLPETKAPAPIQPVNAPNNAEMARRLAESAHYESVMSRTMLRDMQQIAEHWQLKGLTITAAEHSQSPALSAAVDASSGAASAAQSAAGTSQNAPAGAGCAEISSGTVLYGTSDILIDSDVQSPVLVTIREGSFRGAKLIGSFERVQDKGVILKFERMVLPDSSECRVQAVALNPETTGAAVATTVDHHYLERYGTMLVSAFAQGFGQAVIAANSTYTVTPFGGVIQTVSNLPVSQEALMALGTVGQYLGSNMRQLFSIPPTVKVEPGADIAVLFVSSGQTEGNAQRFQQASATQGMREAAAAPLQQPALAPQQQYPAAYPVAPTGPQMLVPGVYGYQPWPVYSQGYGLAYPYPGAAQIPQW